MLVGVMLCMTREHDGVLRSCQIARKINKRVFEKLVLVTSETRLGEITPLWQNFKILGQCFQGLVSKTWENF